jgi:hypothetical protein
MDSSPGTDPFDDTRIQSKGVDVGAGDFVAFSLIAAHSYLYFPLYVFVMTVLLVMLGIIINATIVIRDGAPHPGIPLPAILAIFPWLVYIGWYSFFLVG